MRINVHAGHNPDGKVACGAVGILKESTEARNVVKYLIEELKAKGHTVYDCTVNDGISQGDVLKKIVAKCNGNKDIDLDISIHFNAGVNDLKGNGITTGTECFVYSSNSVVFSYGKVICEKIADLGYRNRGVKLSQSLYFLNNTKAQAILVECCFVDDKDDADIYDAKKMAKAIADAIGTAEGFKEEKVEIEESIIIVDGKEVSIRRILNEGTNYIAIRDVAEAVGYTVGNKGNIAVLKKAE